MKAIDRPILEKTAALPIRVEELIEASSKIRNSQLPAEEVGCAWLVKSCHQKHQAAECLVDAVVRLRGNYGNEHGCSDDQREQSQTPIEDDRNGREQE